MAMQSDFFAAMMALRDGKEITRTDWGNPAIRGKLVDGKVMILRPDVDKMWHPWTINDGDLFATDWVVLG